MNKAMAVLLCCCILCGCGCKASRVRTTAVVVKDGQDWHTGHYFVIETQEGKRYSGYGLYYPGDVLDVEIIDGYRVHVLGLVRGTEADNDTDTD